MTANTNNNWRAMTDTAIIKEIGSYVKQHRLEKNVTQATVARQAGLNRWTISQLENGEGVSLKSLIQILRALDILHVFNSFKYEKQFSPLQLAKLEHQTRERARRNDVKRTPNDLW